jgi:sugar (pentulose or hexulose) kinase
MRDAFLFYGFDFGTSGVRCCLIDSKMSILHEDSLSWPKSTATAGSTVEVAESWEIAVTQLLEQTPQALRGDIQRICISGTSSTALIYNGESNTVSRQPRMYDFNVLAQQASVSEYGE